MWMDITRAGDSPKGEALEILYPRDLSQRELHSRRSETRVHPT